MQKSVSAFVTLDRLPEQHRVFLLKSGACTEFEDCAERKTGCQSTTWNQRGSNVNAHLEVAPSSFPEFSAPKNVKKPIFLAPVTIVELFASHAPRRMKTRKSGDGLQGYFHLEIHACRGFVGCMGRSFHLASTWNQYAGAFNKGARKFFASMAGNCHPLAQIRLSLPQILRFG